MNALAKITAGEHLADPLTILEIRAEVRAWLWWRWIIEMDEAVDPLQEFAERNGLVAALGQDAVQTIIAEPFARFRGITEPA